MGIERGEALEGRYGHQEVAPDVAHHALDFSLVVALARTAEPVLEQVVGLELGERPGALSPAIAQDSRHRQLGIVVENALRDSAQEGERRDVAVQEGLGGLGRVGLHKAAVAVGQVQDEVVGFLLNAPYMMTKASPKSHWAWPGAWESGTNISLRPPPMLPHVVLDRGVSTVEAVLVPEPLEDALGGVALLPGGAVILFQDLVDDAGEGL